MNAFALFATLLRILATPCDSLRRHGNSMACRLFPYHRKTAVLRPYGNSRRAGVFPYRRKRPYLRRYEDSVIEIANPFDHIRTRLIWKVGILEKRGFPQTQTYQTVHSGGTRQMSPPSSARERNSTFASGGNAIDRSTEKLHNTVMPDGNLHPKPSSPQISGSSHRRDVSPARRTNRARREIALRYMFRLESASSFCEYAA